MKHESPSFFYHITELNKFKLSLNFPPIFSSVFENFGIFTIFFKYT